jgi:hypothetical protein
MASEKAKLGDPKQEGEAVVDAAAADPTFAGLPDALHLSVMAYLREREPSAVSGMSRSLLQLYGCRRTQLSLPGRHRCCDQPGPGVGRLASLHRPPRGAVRARGGRCLCGATGGSRDRSRCGAEPGEAQEAGEEEKMTSEGAATLAGLFDPSQALLPALEELVLDCNWADSRDMTPFVAALGRGGAPQLRTLGLRMPSGESEAAVAMGLGTALEARAVLNCRELAQLSLNTFNRVVEGPLEARKLLLPALLPTVESLPPFVGPEVERKVIDAVLEYGAPCLQSCRFTLPDALE